MNLVDQAIQKTLDRQVAAEAMRQSVPHRDPGLEELQRAHEAIATSRQKSEAVYGPVRNYHEPAPMVIQPDWDKDGIRIFDRVAYPSAITKELIRGMGQANFLAMLAAFGVKICEAE